MCILENGIYSISFFSIQTIKHCIICLTFLAFYEVNVNFIKSKFAKSPKRITQPRSTKQIITLIHCTYLCVFGAKIQRDESNDWKYSVDFFAPFFLCSSFCLRFFMMLTGYWTHTEGFRLSKSQQCEPGNKRRSNNSSEKESLSLIWRCFLHNKNLAIWTDKDN